MLTKVGSCKWGVGSWEIDKIPNSKFQIPNNYLIYSLNFKSKIFLFGIWNLFFGISSYAQCAMCRAALTSEGNTKKAEAVNDGIVFLMAVPYVLVGIIGFIIYRMFRKKRQ